MGSKLHVTTPAERGGLSIKLNAIVHCQKLKLTKDKHDMITRTTSQCLSSYDCAITIVYVIIYRLDDCCSIESWPPARRSMSLVRYEWKTLGHYILTWMATKTGMNIDIIISIFVYYALLSFPCYNWCRMNSCHDETLVKKPCFAVITCKPKYSSI